MLFIFHLLILSFRRSIAAWVLELASAYNFFQAKIGSLYHQFGYTTMATAHFLFARNSIEVGKSNGKSASSPPNPDWLIVSSAFYFEIGIFWLSLFSLLLLIEIFLTIRWPSSFLGQFESLDDLLSVYEKISEDQSSSPSQSNALLLARFSMMLSKIYYRQGKVCSPSFPLSLYPSLHHPLSFSHSFSSSLSFTQSLNLPV